MPSNQDQLSSNLCVGVCVGGVSAPLTAYHAIPVITLFLSHKEFQLEKLTKWAELTQESKKICGIR